MASQEQIADPTTRYAVSMLVDCLAADLDPDNREVGLQTYFALICKQVACRTCCAGVAVVPQPCHICQVHGYRWAFQASVMCAAAVRLANTVNKALSGLLVRDRPVPGFEDIGVSVFWNRR